mgnify:CR=1 FL=1
MFSIFHLFLFSKFRSTRKNVIIEQNFDVYLKLHYQLYQKCGSMIWVKKREPLHLNFKLLAIVGYFVTQFSRIVLHYGIRALAGQRPDTFRDDTFININFVRYVVNLAIINAVLTSALPCFTTMVNCGYIYQDISEWTFVCPVFWADFMKPCLVCHTYTFVIRTAIIRFSTIPRVF